MGKKSKSGLLKSSINKRELTDLITQFLSERKGESFSLRKLFQGMKLTTHPLKMLCVDILNSMLDEGTLVRKTNDEITMAGAAHTMEGVFNRTSGGRNFVDTDEGIGISSMMKTRCMPFRVTALKWECTPSDVAVESSMAMS